MADLAKDIEQLKQLKSDLEQFSKRQPEIETIKKKISKREAEITEKIQSDPKYGPRDWNGNFEPVTTARYRLYGELNQCAANKNSLAKKITLILITIADLIGLGILWKLLFDFYLDGGPYDEIFPYIQSGIVSTVVVCLIPGVILFFVSKFILAIVDATVPSEANLKDPKYAQQFHEADKADARATAAFEQVRKEIPSRIADASNNDSQLVADRNKLKNLETEQATVALRIIRNDVLSDQDKDIALVDYVYSQLTTRRADSVKEALQRYDDKKERDLQDFRAALQHARELEEQRRIDEERWEEQQRREARLDREREELRKQYESDNEKLRDKLDELERSFKS